MLHISGVSVPICTNFHRLIENMTVHIVTERNLGYTYGSLTPILEM